MDVHQKIQVIQKYCNSLKKQCIAEPVGQLKYPFITPTGSSFKNVGYHDLVDWDSVHAGAAFAMDGDPMPLKYSMMNLIDHIDADGKGHRRIAHDRYVAFSYTIRPWLCLGTFIAARETDAKFLKENGRLDQLEKYLEYFQKNRLGKHGLCKWLYANESGMDNSLGYSTRDGNSVEAVDLNVLLSIEYVAFARLCEMCGDKDRAENARTLSKNLVEKVNTVLYDAKDGFYYCNYNTAGENGVMIRRRCHTLLYPLYAGIVEKERADSIIQNYLLNKDEFWANYGIYTLSRSDIAYNNAIRGTLLSYPEDAFGKTGLYSNCSNWQGPVWIISNFLMMIALKNYGYTEQAEELMEKTVEIVWKDIEQNGCMHENYNGMTGEPLCAEGFGSWDFLVPQMEKELKAKESFYRKGLY